jgi:hypothetical protein
MMDLWTLPTRVTLGDTEYSLHTDYRDILEIFSYLEDPDLPVPVRWRIAMALFYGEPVPRQHWQAALDFMTAFLTCGRQEQPGPRLMDWNHDATAILAGVNRVAGQEIRALPYVHWWSFLSWFHAMEPGQLSTLVSIRQRLRQGKPLESWQQEFYRANIRAVELPQRLSQQEQQQRTALLARLDAPCVKGAEHGT